MDAIKATELAIVPVWRQVGPGLREELAALWRQADAITDPAMAAARAEQAVCIARDDGGQIRAVGTAVLRVLPRLRQPMYYYRQFFAPSLRGNGHAIPMYNQARHQLEAYNASLPSPESLGVLVELESTVLAARCALAYEPDGDSAFIGYSPRGLQLRVSYFAGARLQAPAASRRVA